MIIKHKFKCPIMHAPHGAHAQCTTLCDPSAYKHSIYANTMKLATQYREADEN